jgi:hypothetical protein
VPVSSFDSVGKSQARSQSVTGTHVDIAANKRCAADHDHDDLWPTLYVVQKKSHRFWTRGVIGESHGTEGIFHSTTGALDGWNSFALQVGGGIDMRIAYHFAMRAIQADWIRIQFPNGATNVQNTLRLGAGVVLRLSR